MSRDLPPDGGAPSDGPRRADRDLGLLQRSELRGVRLLLEFLKPELGMRDLGVLHTVVVFASTRLLDPEIARERVAEAERRAGAAPGDRAAIAGLEQARRALELSRYYQIARDLGRIIGEAGTGPDDHRLIVMTGAGGGGMEAANRGAHDVGALSAGLNITLPLEQHVNPWVTPELAFEFRYFALRKLHFMLRARALVALPGGFGTFDELFDALCLVQTGKHEPLPIVLIGEAFWRRVVDLDALVELGMIAPEDRALVHYTETAQAAWDWIVDWYASRGRSVFDPRDPSSEGEFS